MKQTQLKWVVEQLRENGEITRNFCLQNFVSRLSAIILKLKAMGWEFETEHREGDYVYKLKAAPELPVAPISYVRHPLTGERITSQEYSML